MHRKTVSAILFVIFCYELTTKNLAEARSHHSTTPAPRETQESELRNDRTTGMMRKKRDMMETAAATLAMGLGAAQQGAAVGDSSAIKIGTIQKAIQFWEFCG